MEHRDCDTVLFTISMDRKGYLDKTLRFRVGVALLTKFQIL